MSLIRVEQSDGVATITLDDPERRNNITLPMVDEIVAAFDELESDDRVGAIVVTGAPPAFCSGAALGDLATISEKGLRAPPGGISVCTACSSTSQH